jgi:hypothetical protein
MWVYRVMEERVEIGYYTPHWTWVLDSTYSGFEPAIQRLRDLQGKEAVDTHPPDAQVPAEEAQQFQDAQPQAGALPNEVLVVCMARLWPDWT